MPETHLTPQSPLMHPVEYQGQTYFTAQFFHRQYVENTSQETGKYRHYKDFLRLLRSIETYQKHKDLGNVLEIEFSRIKTEAAPILVQWKDLFQASGYHAITLINATAQAALSHHLDDEISKQLSVAINTQATRRAATEPMIEEVVAYKLRWWLEIGEMLGTPAHITHQEAVKAIEASTGVNLRPLLKAAPSQDLIADDDIMFEPTELAKRLGLSSGKVVNLLLEQIGWQIKRHGIWEPTDAGGYASAQHAWTSEHGTKSGYNYKWGLSAVRQAFYDAGLLPIA